MYVFMCVYINIYYLCSICNFIYDLNETNIYLFIYIDNVKTDTIVIVLCTAVVGVMGTLAFIFYW